MYRVDRGNVETIIMSQEFIPELNALPDTILRMANSYNLLGHITGLDIMNASNFYAKIPLNKLTPALPRLTPSFKLRMDRDIKETFPQSSKE